jgi:hypothetical protein
MSVRRKHQPQIADKLQFGATKADEKITLRANAALEILSLDRFTAFQPQPGGLESSAAISFSHKWLDLIRLQRELRLVNVQDMKTVAVQRISRVNDARLRQMRAFVWRETSLWRLMQCRDVVRLPRCV